MRFFAETEFVKFRESAGRICAETISPYPPGHSGHLAGRRDYTSEIIEYLRLEMKAGVRIQGPYDDELRVIRVVKE